jgi:hypothetical protein
MNELNIRKHAIELHPDIRVLISEDYPRSSWYSKESWDLKDWEGDWFAKECPFLDIYLPLKENLTINIFDFAHELGHAKDFIQNKEVWSKIASRPKGMWFLKVSAWVQAKKFLDRIEYQYSQEDLRAEIYTSLKVYKRLKPQDESIAMTISRIMSGGIPPISDQVL